MKYIKWRILAAALNYLPARLARRYAKRGMSTASISQDKNLFQLLIDVSVIYQNDARTGIQRVVRALIFQLQRNPPKGYCIRPVFATRRHGYHYAPADFSIASTRVASQPTQQVQVQNGDIFLGLDLCAHMIPRHQAQLFKWKQTGVQLHLLVYDLLPLLQPQFFNQRTTRNFERWLRWISVYADNAICISQTVRVELNTWLNARFRLPPAELRTRSIVLGANISSSIPTTGLPKDAGTFLEKLRSTRSILMIGTVEPRKGYEETLAAFEKIWQKSEEAPLLIIVGRAGWKTEGLQKKFRTHPLAGKYLFWLDAVSDQYLEDLYKNCFGVLIASYAEGFGLPLVEAALHRKPILARNLAVFREMRSDGVTYFDSENSEEMAAELFRWLENCESVVPPTLSQASLTTHPTWELSARQLVHAMRLESQIAASAHNHHMGGKLEPEF